MNHLLGMVSTVKAIKRSIADTGANHEMEPNYEYSLSYQHYSIRYYANLCNGERGPITVYGTTLLQLGGKVIYNQNIDDFNNIFIKNVFMTMSLSSMNYILYLCQVIILWIFMITI